MVNELKEQIKVVGSPNFEKGSTSKPNHVKKNFHNHKQRNFQRHASHKKIFRYLRDTPCLGLWYPKDSSFNLHAYSNADYGSYKIDRKSKSGTCQFLGCMLISWLSKKNKIV